ncbi:HAMP domain-containing sensor histidine kinase [Cognatiyoonia sp. IB215446]|uniref:sensor histidine kinase n=1 Tax=Cognatiyoonia sp. IB215446 TaxID=3097355 RepID=UPI002A1456D8|nr:HAMP domain-containing sensor histidine kinase [Cognatiyoonia sp. IB215446]MDX8349909.1 HAMP domain-containing sensor histidine kinase [Cognatiyoonia sp. IB215446]
MISLRRRAVAGGMLWAAVTIVLGLAGLWSYTLSATNQRFADQVTNRHVQALVAVGNYSGNPDALLRRLSDPAYARPFSGQYWQIENDQGLLLTSPSLVETLLPRAENIGDDTEVGEFTAANGENLFGIAQWLTLEDGSNWHVQVASNVDVLDANIANLRQTLLLAFLIICTIGVVGALVQVTVVLQPLNALRADVMRRWDDVDGMEASAYPVEVAPLVTDINTLLKRNQEIIGRSRRQAADLAHAIKTPSAIMRNELGALQANGQDVSDAMNALDTLDAQLKRSFARMRADDTQNAMPVVTEGTETLTRMVRAFTALARNAGRTLSSDVAPGLRIRIDKSDLEEITGNLLDNAVKFSGGHVHLSARRDGDRIMITIEDDGPGIAEEDKPKATQSGQRLDTAKPGTGLGLAIVDDLVQAYGGSVTLERSADHGGLSVIISLEAAGRKATR